MGKASPPLMYAARLFPALGQRRTTGAAGARCGWQHQCFLQYLQSSRRPGGHRAGRCGSPRWAASSASVGGRSWPVTGSLNASIPAAGAGAESWSGAVCAGRESLAGGASACACSGCAAAAGIAGLVAGDVLTGVEDFWVTASDRGTMPGIWKVEYYIAGVKIGESTIGPDYLISYDLDTHPNAPLAGPVGLGRIDAGPVARVFGPRGRKAVVSIRLGRSWPKLRHR